MTVNQHEAIQRSSSIKSFLFIFVFLETLIMLFCGIGMLAGSNKARIIYTVLGIFSLIHGIIKSPSDLTFIIKAVIFLTACFFLFSGRANAYFTGMVFRAEEENNY
jgi:hypothetical protein